MKPWAEMDDAERVTVLEKRVAELEAGRSGLIRGLIDWCEINVTNYGERSCIQRHLRTLHGVPAQ